MKRSTGGLFGGLRAWAAVLAAGAAVLLCSAFARAADKLSLKDGRVLEGEIVREIDGSVMFKWKDGATEKTEFFLASDIVKLEKDAVSDPAGDAKPADPAAPAPEAPEAAGGAAEADKGAGGGAAGAEAPVAVRPGVPRIALLTLGEEPGKEMVGIYITAQSLRDVIPLLEKEQVTDVVFRIESGGGLGLEVQRLSDVLYEEFVPKFRTVAWIRSAISAAAMTAHVLPEIYFMRNGNYGACTGWFGAMQAVQGRGLEDYLYAMERISAKGEKNPKIMRSMQIMEPLSATIDENGEVHWYQDETSGQIVVNPSGRILTFNAMQAEELKFSRGTADTIQELQKAMGYQEADWVGVQKKGYSYPISKAEASLMNFRKKTADDQEGFLRYVFKYESMIQAAQSEQDKKDRAKFVNQARQALRQMKSMVDNNHNFALLQWGRTYDQFLEWYQEQEELLKRLMK